MKESFFKVEHIYYQAGDDYAYHAGSGADEEEF
jgi:hypothetical protein